MQRLVTRRPTGAEDDRLAVGTQQRPWIEFRIAVADRVEVDHQREFAALAGGRYLAQKVAFSFETGRLRVVEDQSVNPLVVEDQMTGTDLLEVAYPLIGIQAAPKILHPLLDRVRTLRFVDEARHYAECRGFVPVVTLGRAVVGPGPDGEELQCHYVLDAGEDFHATDPCFHGDLERVDSLRCSFAAA